jgi:hypothetical protein
MRPALKALVDFLRDEQHGASKRPSQMNRQETAIGNGSRRLDGLDHPWQSRGVAIGSKGRVADLSRARPNAVSPA